MQLEAQEFLAVFSRLDHVQYITYITRVTRLNTKNPASEAPGYVVRQKG